MLCQKQQIEQSRKTARKSKRISRREGKYEIFPSGRDRRAARLSQWRTPSRQEELLRLSPHILDKSRTMMEMNRSLFPTLLLKEMNKTAEQQCLKLEELLKIKLQRSSDDFFQSKKLKDEKNFKELEMKPFQIQKEEDNSLDWIKKAGQQGQIEIQADIQSAWSCEQELPAFPVMRRWESARLLCDNYQKQELIYSFETLIPKMPREDINFHQPDHFM